MREYELEIQSEMRDGVIDGAAICSGDSVNDLFSGNYGYAEKSLGIPMRADTIIDIASITKVLATTTAFMICKDRKLIDPDAFFTDYLPEYDAPLFTPLTLRDLAMHVSGFSVAKGHGYMAETGREIMNNLLHFAPLYPPRQKHEYACFNFLILAAIVEKVTGESLKSFCEKNIFNPLGMNDTSMGRPVTEDPVRLAKTITTARGGMISDFTAAIVYRDGLCAGNAGCFSTLEDLKKFCRCMLNRGKYKNTSLFSEDSFQEMTRNRMPEHLAEKRGFGWVISDAYKPEGFSEKTIYHSGWSGQSIFIDIEKQFFSVVLTTRMGDYERAKTGRSKIAASLLKSTLRMTS